MNFDNQKRRSVPKILILPLKRTCSDLKFEHLLPTMEQTRPKRDSQEKCRNKPSCMRHKLTIIAILAFRKLLNIENLFV